MYDEIDITDKIKSRFSCYAFNVNKKHLPLYDLYFNYATNRNNTVTSCYLFPHDISEKLLKICRYKKMGGK